MVCSNIARHFKLIIEFKNEVTKLLEKHNVLSVATKYKHNHTVFVEASKEELAKLLFKPMDA